MSTKIYLPESKKVTRFGGTKHYVAVSPNKNEWGEFHVKMYKGGKHYEPADHFTNDWEDAVGTAKHMHGELQKEFGDLGESNMNKKKTIQEYVREDKLFIITEDSGKQKLFKHSANTNDDTLVYIAENAEQMRNYFRTRNIDEMPVPEKKEAIMEEKKDLKEASMFQGGPDNMTTGNSPTDYRSYLAAELFGSTSFASQMPYADTHQEAANIIASQAQDGMGVMTSGGGDPARMFESSINKQLLSLAKNLFRAGRMDEAAKIVDATEKPEDAAKFVLEAAMSTDGNIPAELTEELYQTAAFLNTLEEK